MNRSPDMPVGPSNLSHTRFMGAYLATLAIRDAVCFLHTGEGCKVKTSLHQIYHDWFREAHNSQIWTDTKEVELIQGGAERMAGFVRTWLERRKPSAAFVLTTGFVELTGEDFARAVEAVDNDMDTLVRHISTVGFEGDVYEGYRAAIRQVLQACDWGVEPQPNKVNIVGHFFDRYEADRIADVNEIRRVFRGLGLDVQTVYLSGSPVSELLKAGEAAANIVLPYCWDDAKWMEETTGRPSILIGLPMGLEGTRRALETVREKMGLELGDEFIGAEIGHAASAISTLANRINEPDAVRTFALFADTVLAAGMVGTLRDYGLQDVLVGLMDRSLGGSKRFEELLSLSDPTELPVVEPLEAPERNVLIDALDAVPEKPDLLLGSSVELQDLRELNLPGMEIGYPSFARHGLYPMPTLGFRGAVAIAQRVLNALSQVY